MKNNTLSQEKPWYAADFTYLRIPKVLLQNPAFRALTPEAVLLYGALLDRFGLSVQHIDQFVTKGNKLFVYYTLNSISELLRCGHDKATAVLRELVKAHLIETRRSGVGRPYQIILIPIDWHTGQAIFDEHADWPD